MWTAQNSCVPLAVEFHPSYAQIPTLYNFVIPLVLCTQLFRFRFSPFYWAGFVAQRERAQQDFKVPYKVPHLTPPPFTYERQPQHRDHPTLIRIVRGFFYVPQDYQHSRNCETGPSVYRPYPRRLESRTICR